jgi:hypothetical protein
MSEIRDVYGAMFGGGERRSRPQDRLPKGSRLSRFLLSLAATVIFGLLYFYVRLPALNIHSGQLYWFIFWLCAAYGLCMLSLRGARPSGPGEYFSYFRKRLAVPFWLVVLILIVSMGAASRAGSSSAQGLFRAARAGGGGLCQGGGRNILEPDTHARRRLRKQTWPTGSSASSATWSASSTSAGYRPS